jgi:2-isopropylmalate synthase
MQEPGRVYDWNHARERRRLVRQGVTFQDETLRDGIQNPSVVDPQVSDKLQLVHAMNALGIQRVNVGLPASSARNREDTLAACQEIARAKLEICPVAAGRTVVSDVMAIAEISQHAGLAIEVYTFIGSSAIRQLVEAWDLAFLQDKTRAAVAAAVREGLAVCYVTEDTTRARPETLRALWSAAIDAGATRLCLTDTVGHGTPDGVRNLLRFAQDVCAELGVPETGLDWHGHDDRGLALDNALTALEHGADRIHGTALGIGERCGNTAMEVLLYNLMLLGELELDVDRLLHYSRVAAGALHWPVPAAHILIGESSTIGHAH